jgi:hypothetical protein
LGLRKFVLQVQNDLIAGTDAQGRTLNVVAIYVAEKGKPIHVDAGPEREIDAQSAI